MVQGLFAGAPGAARGASLQGRKIPVGQWSTKTPGSTRLQEASRLQGSKTPVEQWGAKTAGSAKTPGEQERAGSSGAVEYYRVFHDTGHPGPL